MCWNRWSLVTATGHSGGLLPWRRAPSPHHEVYEFLEAEDFSYAIRLPANKVLQGSIAHLLKRPVGRPPNDVRRYHAGFSDQAATWDKPRRVVAKVAVASW